MTMCLYHRCELVVVVPAVGTPGGEIGPSDHEFEPNVRLAVVKTVARRCAQNRHNSPRAAALALVDRQVVKVSDDFDHSVFLPG